MGAWDEASIQWQQRIVACRDCWLQTKAVTVDNASKIPQIDERHHLGAVRQLGDLLEPQLTDQHRGHVNAIFTPTCNRVVDLVRLQIQMVENKMKANPKVNLSPHLN